MDEKLKDLHAAIKAEEDYEDAHAHAIKIIQPECYAIMKWQCGGDRYYWLKHDGRRGQNFDSSISAYMNCLDHLLSRRM